MRLTNIFLLSALALGGCAQSGITPYTGPRATAEEREVYFQTFNDNSSCDAKLARERGFPEPVRREICKCVQRHVADNIDDGFAKAIAANRGDLNAVQMTPGEIRRVSESMATVIPAAYRRCVAD